MEERKAVVVHEHYLEDKSITMRVRHKAQVLLYQLVTGYRHTGERVHPLFTDNNFINHLRVYQFLSQFVGGKDDVLDVGCGTGTGTALLSRTARRVVGIDISLAAIREAYRFHPECQFVRMNAENLSFADDSFDMIVSTENFEHLREQSKHLGELARVLRGGGFGMIATPNPELSGAHNNRFHIKENTYTELKNLLSCRFADVETIEPTKLPVDVKGSVARKERFARGEHGKLVGPDLEIFGRRIDQTFLSNTHSFFCFFRQHK